MVERGSAVGNCRGVFIPGRSCDFASVEAARCRGDIRGDFLAGRRADISALASLTSDATSDLDVRVLGVKIGAALKLVPERNDAIFRKCRPNNLQAHGKAIDKTAGHGDGGQAG